MARMIERFFLSVWDRGISPDELADELERIAGLIREEYSSGEMIGDGLRGWWDTTAMPE